MSKLLLIPPLLLLLLTGCNTTIGSNRPEFHMGMVNISDDLSPSLGSSDLTRGKRAALVAFNTAVVPDYRSDTDNTSLLTRSINQQRYVPGTKLRELGDAMLNTFADNFRQIPNLEWIPIDTVRRKRYYRRLPYQESKVIPGILMASGEGRKFAPVGYRLISVPDSDFEKLFRGGLGGAISSHISGIFSSYERDMAKLADELNVDFVVCVNNVVTLVPV